MANFAACCALQSRSASDSSPPQFVRAPSSSDALQTGPSKSRQRPDGRHASSGLRRRTFLGDDVRFECSHNPATLASQSERPGSLNASVARVTAYNSPFEHRDKFNKLVQQPSFGHSLLSVIGDACSTDTCVAVGALQSLYLFLEGEEDYTLLVEEEWETLNVLLPLLANKEPEIATIAAQILDLLCLQECTRAKLASMRIVPQLLMLLRRREKKVLIYVARVLFSLLEVRNREVVEEVPDAIGSLVRMADEANPELQRLAAGILFALSVDERNWLPMGQDGAIPCLVALLDSPSAEAREYAARALGALACCEPNWRGIMRSGGFEKLVGMLTEAQDTLRESAATAIFAPSHEYDASVFEPAVRPLVSGLSSENARLQAACASALWGLAGHPRVRRLIGEAGGVPGLTALVASSASPKTVEYALRALALLAQEERELQAALNLGAREACMRRLADGDERVVWAAGRALWQLTAPHAPVTGSSWNN